MKRMMLVLSVITLALALGGGAAKANVILGAYNFNSNQFGNALVESDGGTFSGSNWLNIVNTNPGNPGYLTSANFNTGIANIGLSGSPSYTISYNTPIVNQTGNDLGIVTARFSINDTATLSVSTDGGTTFSSSINFGPAAAAATGAGYSYYYGGGGPYSSFLFVTVVDLSDFGILSGAAINAIKITGSPELDLIRVAGLETTNAVPEPVTILLLGFGLVGLAGAARRFKK